MIWKSLIRTYFLEYSLNTVFDKLRRNLNAGPVLGLPGDIYLGPLYAGMMFSKMVWKYTSLSLGDILEVYNEVVIKDIIGPTPRQNKDDNYLIKFEYISNGIVLNDSISIHCHLTFYM